MSFVVSDEASEAWSPGEGVFYDLTTRQEHEAAFCHRVLDYFEPYGGCRAVAPRLRRLILCRPGRHRPVPRFARDLLDLLGQGRNLVPIALIGRRDILGQRVALYVTALYTFDLLRRLAPS